MMKNPIPSLAVAAVLLLGTAPTVLAQEAGDGSDAHHADDQAPTQTPAQPGQPGMGAMMQGGMMDPQMMQMMQKMMSRMMLHMMQHQIADDGRGAGHGQMGGSPDGMGMGPMSEMMGSMMKMMSHMMQGRGAMGAARGDGAMAACPMAAQGVGPGLVYGVAAADGVSVEEARAMVDRLLAHHGNPRLETGELRVGEDGNIVAEIVTVDGSLVQRLAIDRETGEIRQAD